MKSPFAAIKEKFGDKAKLVAEIEKLAKDEDLWVGRLNKHKGLAHVSNAKLLKLQATFAAVKEKFGTRAKLIDAILEVEKRVKDDGYKIRLTAFPVPRLWDLYRSVAKRSGAAAKAASGEKPAKKAVQTPKKAAAAVAPKKTISAKAAKSAAAAKKR
jgi:hypothetical protein